jgi:hypothetical protein
MAVSAENESCAVWATNNAPPVYCTNAALPTAAKGEAESMAIVIIPPTAEACMRGKSGALETGSSEEQPGKRADKAPLKAASDASWQALRQNSRRVWISVFFIQSISFAMMCSLCSGCRSFHIEYENFCPNPILFSFDLICRQFDG